MSQNSFSTVWSQSAWTRVLSLGLSLLLICAPILSLGCSLNPKPSTSQMLPAPVAAAAPFVVRLLNHRSMAHGCPVSPDVFFSSRHVLLDENRFTGKETYQTFVWSDEVGGGGAAIGVAHSTNTDFAIGVIDREFQKFFPIAQTEPSVGDPLYLINFNFDDKHNPPMEALIHTATYAGRVGAQMIYRPSGTYGSSGSCVFNSSGEVVAVNQGAPFGELGHGPAVFGAFNPLPGFLERDPRIQ